MITPFKTNEQKNTERKFREEKEILKKNLDIIKQSQDPLLELKINQLQPQQQIQKMPEVYPSPYVPIPNPYYPNMANPYMPWQYTPNNVPIIKKYNISLGNGNGDITKIANLYEDILPSQGNVTNNTFNTLKERMIIHHYIRSIFIKTGDGEELLINGGPNNTKSEITNLLSHVKLLEINPYHFNRLTDNPYRTLPANFVMYRSCYPIRLNSSNLVECSKSSIGMNVRIYLLSKYDNEINTGEGLSRYNSDIWRELDYYQFIREEIVKVNMSPNFITLHSYYMTKNTGINFKKFENIRGQIETRNFNIEKSNADIRNRLYIKYIKHIQVNNKDNIITFDDLIREGLVTNNIYRDVTEEERKLVIEKRIDKLVAENKYKHYLDSDKCLVMLSEAPTQNIYNWATRTYQSDNGPVKKMIQSGYHADNVWESIFFQLLIAMIIMFNKEIMFTEFNITNNVYIKDLNHSENNIGIWKYVQDGIDFFVPNYGYLLLIDSNFNEIMNHKLYDHTYLENIQHRIKSTLLRDSNNSGEIYKLCLEKMIDIFSSNNFNKEFTNYGGISPTENFLRKLDRIRSTIENIKDEVFNGMPWSDVKKIDILSKMNTLPITLTTDNVFNNIHSRIGTPVKDQEIPYEGDYIPDIKYGSIITYTFRGDIRVFAIYLGRNTDVINQSYILVTTEIIYTNDDRNNILFRKISVTNDNLHIYNGYLEQSYEPGKQYNILETYLVSRHK